ncbi:hypothetical protein DTO021D3_3861 [Paecilomyces variotii]|nr:hypothetical protein DTO032I3_8982 [Paecilomyces variotii]KAJ9279405.1 hypothetical protein DTO021D3_3861 [Paecilomyces variotii]KAJ9341250.1 hypothetical protein DTO027B6_6231 [Paecilomyces variotii]KAJ9348042.1 hypothetical protein DTO027B9_8631 [Paecilomyces variotii]KAJ9380573.1 hypothetical protein DTO032I4_6661 [Paecilomyces variotii]
MEKTFITIHDLTQDARIRYASDTIEDILGYQPQEVVNKSCWDYLHPDDIPFARTVHGRGVKLDKAAVLKYCQVKHRNGSWVGCECVFTVVYDVLVASISIYRRGSRSEKRAADAPVVRSLFTSSPRDPRYHMLTCMSSRFSQQPRNLPHEPRAALFLNRFTRTSTIMFATNGVTEILGVTPQQLVSKSFYYCIQERCLRDAVCCIESAKTNDSIAYLRFWYRNPLQGDGPSGEDEDVQMTEANDAHGNGSEPGTDGLPSSGTGAATDPARRDRIASARLQIEVEAVVSCSSDGLVVVLRRARPPIPLNINQTPDRRVYANGLFASPWAADPIFSHSDSTDVVGASGGPGTVAAVPTTSSSSCSHSQLLFDTIRDVAVFAWGIIGINGSLEKYKRGTPTGESQPPGGPQVFPQRSSSSRRLAGDMGTNSFGEDNRSNSGCSTYHQNPPREASSCRRAPSDEPHETGVRERCDPAPPWEGAGSPGP